jgi:hypothetical protein
MIRRFLRFIKGFVHWCFRRFKQPCRALNSTTANAPPPKWGQRHIWIENTPSGLHYERLLCWASPIQSDPVSGLSRAPFSLFGPSTQAVELYVVGFGADDEGHG